MRRFLCASLLLLAALALGGCGNKGALVKASATTPASSSSLAVPPAS
ncbi:MAG: hypothetical protein L0H70_04715 [Xanthomonadales bacterium]|nr:hypothetical protein [Xanthomonadales bacterium]